MNELLKLCHDHAGKSSGLGAYLHLFEKYGDNLTDTQQVYIKNMKSILKDMNQVIDNYYTVEKVKINEANDKRGLNELRCQCSKASS